MPPISQAARTAQSLISDGRVTEAVASLQAHVRRQPRDAYAHALLGLSLASSGQFDRALFHARHAQGLAPDNADVLGFLASVCGIVGRPGDAIDAFRRALALDPDHLNSIEGLTVLLTLEQAYAEVAELAERALRLQPGDGPFTAMLAGARQAYGHSDLALRILEEALARTPDDADLLYARASCLNYVPGVDPDVIAEAHRRYGAAYATEAGQPLPAPGARRPGPLRVGLVSGDFRAHSVAYFLEPLLRNFDHSRFEIAAYSANPARDGVTETLRPLFNEWHDLFALDDRAAAELVRSRDVDVLIDLCGLTAGTRLGVLALRPARVQATYLGYPNTTGLKAIDWRLVDSITDPPGFESRCTEKLARLDGCFVCFGAIHQAAPEPVARTSSGGVTFASFNVLSKVNEPVIECWARIVNRVPGSRLLLKAAVLKDPGAASEMRGRFARAGLASDRLEMMGWVASDPLLLYERVDVALDPFPYNGTTTTCEALWMGVPVVTLAGTTHAGRVGASLLTHAGLQELVAHSSDEYEALAVALALDVPRLAGHRQTLRERMRATISDGQAFARRFENALESMVGR